ncbi:MAG: hypothetical protein LUG61_02730 [Lachnospiraceae bacterium]|nr:hypothetical protein [Lachnospiraceae bacterium]
MKEYIYLPVSTNHQFMKWTRDMKKNGSAKTASFLKTFVPTAAVWLLTGLWHGTGVDYIVWGFTGVF